MQLLLAIGLILHGVALIMGDTDAETYLAKYGYYNPFTFGGSITDALIEYQKFTGIHVTGKLDDETRKQMAVPRCGRPDNDAPNAFRGDSKWYKTHLKYSFLNYGQDMSKSSTRTVIKRAMNMWADVTPLSYSETKGTS